MNITLELTAEEYDLFRAYQREKDALKQKETAVLSSLKKDYKTLCEYVLDALEVDDADLCEEDVIIETVLTATIKDNEAAVKAARHAAEWFS